MAEQRNGPGLPPPTWRGSPTSKLKSLAISGTDLLWVLGKDHSYLDANGDVQTAEIQGMGIVVSPNEPGVLQVVIVYSEYKDYFVCADHLVVRNLHVSEIAVPVAPKVLVPRR